MAIMSFLRREVAAAATVGSSVSASDPLPALELYTVLLFILLSVNDPHAKQLTDEYLSLYTDPKVGELAQRSGGFTWLYFARSCLPIFVE